MGFKNEKFPIFWFSTLVSHRGKGVQHIGKFSPYKSLRSQLSFKPLKVALAPASGEKIDIIAEKVSFFIKIYKFKVL